MAFSRTLRSQLRRVTEEGGKEQAARLKKERSSKETVFKDHISDWEAKQMGAGLSEEEFQRRKKNLTLQDFVDDHGAVDFTEYAAYQFTKNRTMSKGEKTYRHSQKGSEASVKKEYDQRKFREARSEKHTRWEDGHRKVSGFKVTGGHRKIEDQKKKDDEETEHTETIVTKIPDPYKILALPPHASAKHAGDNYKKLARKYHPDAAGGDVKKMAELNTAYDLVKKIIKEGGPTKSSTAAECTQSETVHTVKSKRKSYRTDEEIAHDDEEEILFKLNPHLREERETMRRMAYEFKTSTRAAKRRKDARAERKASAIAGDRPLTQSERGLREAKQLFMLCSLMFLVLHVCLPKDSIKAPFKDYIEGREKPSKN